MKLFFPLGVAGVLAAVLLATVRPQAQETEEEGEPPSVSEAELQLYIDVYSAMQADHSVTVGDALEPHKMSIDQFRALERRIQRQQGLVDRVRQALLEHAKSRAAAVPPPTGANVPTSSP